MNGTIAVRQAVLDDAAAIAEIYNQGIRARIATFETEERSPEERRAWIADHNDRYPIVVATRDENGIERVVGWAAASPYSARACYAGVAEFSIYIHEDERGKGVGLTLITAFIAACGAGGAVETHLPDLSREYRQPDTVQKGRIRGDWRAQEARATGRRLEGQRYR